jgi:hypothetical protein
MDRRLYQRLLERAAASPPALEKIVGWDRPKIREFFEPCRLRMQEWDSVRIDRLTLRPVNVEWSQAASAN